MRILFVINNYYTKGNGLAASARRTVKKLREAGLDVQVLSGPNPDPKGEQPMFLLDSLTLPLVDFIVKKQGYEFAKTELDVIEAAVDWADVVHVEEAFVLQAATCFVARKKGKAITGTYHLHPENLFASAGLEKSRAFNDSVMRFWRDTVFNKCRILQCPTDNVRWRLNKWHYKAELRVISNGLVLEDLMHISPEDAKMAQKATNAPYQLLAIGRFSKEKDYITLLKAMRYTPFAKDIQLVFAGRGPKEAQLKEYAAKLVKKGVLRHEPLFDFFSLPQLQQLAAASDLYIHCAFIEVEGLSCMEAIQTGLVPIIAKCDLSATAQFAQSPASVYRARNAHQLANRITYWLAHEPERKAEAEKYRNLGIRYNIDDSVKALVKMFEDAYRRNEADKQAQSQRRQAKQKGAKHAPSR